MPPPLSAELCVCVECAAHQEALRKEIERLRQIYHQQSLKSGGEPPAPDAAPVRGDKDDMIGSSEGTAVPAPGPPS
jgi:cyclic AMP-dependent transcription factor ATF-4